MRNLEKHFFSRGWCRFDFDAQLQSWIEAALPAARAALQGPQHARWYRCQNTWFAGVNVLPNRPDSSIGASGPLQGKAIRFIGDRLGLRDIAWDKGQVSVCFPGYPKPMADETPGSARYRREHDAAHVDGLLAEGPQRRRHLREGHGFILGIPMLEFDASAAPFVIWEKSHQVIAEIFRQRFDGIPAAQWGEEDVTEVYHAARKQIFQTCKRVEIHARPGQAYLAHRLSLHGIAPWGETAAAPEEGRMICYFRPETCTPETWLNSP